jgi:hypothetical protein
MAVSRSHSKKAPSQNPVDTFKCVQQGGAQGSAQKEGHRRWATSSPAVPCASRSTAARACRSSSPMARAKKGKKSKSVSMMGAAPFVKKAKKAENDDKPHVRPGRRRSTRTRRRRKTRA